MRVKGGVERGEAFEFRFDGDVVTAFPGETVAGALLAAGRRGLRRTARLGMARGFYCGMGLCWECRVVIDGRPAQRACMVEARPGMRVESGPDAGAAEG